MIASPNFPETKKKKPRPMERGLILTASPQGTYEE